MRTLRFLEYIYASIMPDNFFLKIEELKAVSISSKINNIREFLEFEFPMRIETNSGSCFLISHVYNIMKQSVTVEFCWEHRVIIQKFFVLSTICVLQFSRETCVKTINIKKKQRVYIILFSFWINLPKVTQLWSSIQRIRIMKKRLRTIKKDLKNTYKIKINK